MTSTDQAQPLPPEGLRPGWYRDPWGVAQWRWWDGGVWSARVHDGRRGHAPRVNSWLSVPVMIGLVLTVLSLIGLLVTRPGNAILAFALGLIPLMIVMPVLFWLQRVEPEPAQSRLHAFLWGATVAGTISAVVNTAIATRFGMVWAASVSAPVVEELTKGLGVYWALRRLEVDGVMDGIVYAGWVALGFAVVENFQYFSQPDDIGSVLVIFVLRALLTPFAHPLFTAWIGLAIGLAVSRGQSVPVNALWGYGLAVSCHACWNGVLGYSSETGDNRTLLLALGFFILLFFTAGLTLFLIRRHEERRFTQLAPALAQRYGLSASQVALFADWRQVLSARRSLPDDQRRQFDRVHAALARLALYHRRTGEPDPATEERLADQLQHAVEAQAMAGTLPD